MKIREVWATISLRSCKSHLFTESFEKHQKHEKRR
jgi:hypothetical protein